MKVREDFVTNSSSSSFIIQKKDLTPAQLVTVRHIDELVEEVKGISNTGWSIREDDSIITGYTSMDNFDMREFLNEVGIPDNIISWDW